MPNLVILQSIPYWANSTVELDDDDDDADDIKPDKMDVDDKAEDSSITGVDAVNAATTLNNSPTIDNPYLRAAKVPKRTKSESIIT